MEYDNRNNQPNPKVLNKKMPMLSSSKNPKKFDYLGLGHADPRFGEKRTRTNTSDSTTPIEERNIISQSHGLGKQFLEVAQPDYGALPIRMSAPGNQSSRSERPSNILNQGYRLSHLDGGQQSSSRSRKRLETDSDLLNQHKFHSNVQNVLIFIFY